KKKFVEANQSAQSLPRLIVQYAVANCGHPADRRKPAAIVPDDRGLMLRLSKNYRFSSSLSLETTLSSEY
ncbi:hypothetical protein, partial [Agathobaculum butyriciproducens]|uniref:hypothetical protein n=1 Tax=Agathobaculum butyriciproducens TaxID=1628085 RepID=UPI003AF0F45C